jgi:hypothetical protein
MAFRDSGRKIGGGWGKEGRRRRLDQWTSGGVGEKGNGPEARLGMPFHEEDA